GVLVSQLYGVVGTRRGAGGDDGGAGAEAGPRGDAEGGISAGVQDFERADIFDRDHRPISLWLSLPPRGGWLLKGGRPTTRSPSPLAGEGAPKGRERGEDQTFG